MCAKYTYEAKYQYLFNKWERTGIKHFDDSKGWYLKNIEEHDPNKNWKILIVSCDMIADMLSNNKVNPIET